MFMVFLLIFLFREKLLIAFASYFEINNASKGADVMIVLAGNQSIRPHAAMEFFKEGYAKKIYLTNPKEMMVKKYDFMLSQSETALKVFEANGMRDIGVIPSLKGGATSTFDEAKDAAIFFRDKNISRIVIVSDAFHTRRALHAFEKIFDIYKVPIKVEVLAAKNAL